jgi:hypothetical protein
MRLTGTEGEAKANDSNVSSLVIMIPTENIKYI